MDITLSPALELTKIFTSIQNDITTLTTAQIETAKNLIGLFKDTRYQTLREDALSGAESQELDSKKQKTLDQLAKEYSLPSIALKAEEVTKSKNKAGTPDKRSGALFKVIEKLTKSAALHYKLGNPPNIDKSSPDKAVADLYNLLIHQKDKGEGFFEAFLNTDFETTFSELEKARLAAKKEEARLAAEAARATGSSLAAPKKLNSERLTQLEAEIKIKRRILEMQESSIKRSDWLDKNQAALYLPESECSRLKKKEEVYRNSLTQENMKTLSPIESHLFNIIANIYCSPYPEVQANQITPVLMEISPNIKLMLDSLLGPRHPMYRQNEATRERLRAESSELQLAHMPELFGDIVVANIANKDLKLKDLVNVTELSFKPIQKVPIQAFTKLSEHEKAKLQKIIQDSKDLIKHIILSSDPNSYTLTRQLKEDIQDIPKNMPTARRVSENIYSAIFFPDQNSLIPRLFKLAIDETVFLEDRPSDDNQTKKKVLDEMAEFWLGHITNTIAIKDTPRATSLAKYLGEDISPTGKSPLLLEFLNLTKDFLVTKVKASSALTKASDESTQSEITTKVVADYRELIAKLAPYQDFFIRFLGYFHGEPGRSFNKKMMQEYEKNHNDNALRLKIDQEIESMKIDVPTKIDLPTGSKGFSSQAETQANTTTKKPFPELTPIDLFYIRES